MSETIYDIAIIGSGPGGYRAAILAALKGQKVAIIEKGDWGGCCLNRGCVPKKDWHHTARLVAANREFADRGIEGSLTADMHQAWHHQESVVATVKDSYIDYMKRLKIATFTGTARFLDPYTLTIQTNDGDASTLKANAFIIATGAQPHIPEPFSTVAGRVLTTDMLFDDPPPEGKRVAIIGSGVVATEFAFIFTLLGKSVTWLGFSDPLHRLPFSPQALKTLREALDHHGIALQKVDGFTAMEIQDTGVRIQPKGGDPVEVDWVCLGTGRTPHTQSLGLDQVGIECDARGFIRRNACLQTAQPHVYAIGDVASQDMTANHALSDATIAVRNIVDGKAQEQDSTRVPIAIYSAVELARLGMDEDTAEDEGFEPAIGFAAFETSPRALGQDDTAGFVRLIGDMDTGAFLGGEIIGAEAGELIHLLSLAPDSKTALRWLASGRYNHPSRAEELINATETLASKWGLADTLLS